jgi:chromosome segregation protein
MGELQTFEAEADTRRTALAQADAQAAAAQAALAREQERLSRFEADLARAKSELTALGDVATLEAALKDARARHADAEGKSQAAQSALVAIGKAVDDARAAEARLTPPLLAAERHVGELESELKGLDRLLRKTDGTSPPVLDGIRAPGLERALAAALSEDLEAPTDPEAPAHWSGRSGDVSAPLPEGAKPLSDVVQAPGELRARLSQCGLVDRAQGFELLPRLTAGQRLVSREGDLWRWDGFVRSADAPLPAAEKLEQRARRVEIESELTSARAARDEAHEARAKASRTLTDAEMTAMTRRRDAPELARAAIQAHEAARRDPRCTTPLHGQRIFHSTPLTEFSTVSAQSRRSTFGSGGPPRALY